MLAELISHQRAPTHRGDTTMRFGPRRGGFINAADRVFEEGWLLDEATVEQCEAFDLVYRTLCAVMYNYVPLSGHPGGSITSGRFVARLLFDAMDYDLAKPNRQDADIISYAAGYKALGLYAMWALRNEVARIAAPDLLPARRVFCHAPTAESDQRFGLRNNRNLCATILNLKHKSREPRYVLASEKYRVRRSGLAFVSFRSELNFGCKNHAAVISGLCMSVCSMVGENNGSIPRFSGVKTMIACSRRNSFN